MRFLLSLAARNLLRNKRRSAISACAVVAGVALSILGMGLVGGLDENVLRTQIDSMSGHVILRPPGIPTDGLSNSLEGLEPIPEDLSKRLEGMTWAPRLRFDLRLVMGGEGARVMGLGYDPVRDPQVFSRSSYSVEGHWPEEEEGEGVVLGSGLARLLDVSLGDRVTLSVRTMAGAQNALQWPVTGIVETRNPAIDNALVLMPMEQAEVLVRPAGPSQISIRLDSRGEASTVAAQLGGDWTARTYREESEDLLGINRVRRKALSIMVLVVMGIAATGIANTVIMSVFERIREVGTLAAMGMSGRGIFALFLMEGALMGLVAASVGAVVGSLLNLRLSTQGIDVSGLPDAGSQVGFTTTLYTSFSWSIILAALGFGVVVATLASAWPARHASRMKPADAVREQA